MSDPDATRAMLERMIAEDPRGAIRSIAWRAIMLNLDLMPYVPDYFRSKWDYDGELRQLRHLLDLWDEVNPPDATGGRKGEA